MPARIKHTPRSDMQSAFFGHVDANVRAHECCARAIALRQAGQKQAAARAEREAKKWLTKMMAMEGALPPRPQGGRREKL